MGTTAMVLGTLWAMPLAVRAVEPAPPSTTPEIVLKQTDSARVVFLEHVGPYWAVGPLFKQVREAMLAHQETGLMFSRYLADPTAVSNDSLRAEVGFIAQGDSTPQPPFKSAQYEGAQVAAMVVEGSYGTTTRYYAVMRDWLFAHGLEPVGPVIELYPPVPRGAAPSARRTEIQMPVRPAPPTARETVESEDPLGFPHNPERSIPVAEVAGTAASASIEPIRPIKELVGESRFDRIAEQLIPLDRPMTATVQVWLGQVVFRVGAVAKGIEQTFPGGSPPATALSQAIRQRYQQASGSSKVNPLEPAVVRVDTRSDPQSTLKRIIMRDLDNLLGQVALKTVDADSATVLLIDILQRVQDLGGTGHP